jgi:hypothetical protein
MPDRGEQEFVLSRFDGTNLLIDSAYLGPTYLRRSQNWFPGDSYRLEKRPGTAPYNAGALPGTVTRVHALFAPSYPDTHYLFCVAANAGTDTIYYSIDDAAWVAVTGGTFPSDSETYGMEQLNEFLYVANGIDPPIRIALNLPGTGTTLVQLVDFGDTNGGPAPPSVYVTVADTGSSIISGTYAFAWCIYDHNTGTYKERGVHVASADPSLNLAPLEITVSGTGDRAIVFPIPVDQATNGGVLSARYRAHLFVAPVNYPIEFAHDQTPAGLYGVAAYTMRQLTTDGPPIPLHNSVRTGQALRAYLGRLILGVDTTRRQSVWCSQTIAPGLEQIYYDSGQFFPHNGRLPRPSTDVTAIGLAAVGERGRELQGPLVVTTLSQTYLFSGDFLDDPNASFVQVSARAGCIGSKACTETPFGFFYIGTETVWSILSGGGVPVDVGWPIRPAIKDIPSGSRARCLAIYHKGFLKLSIVPAGGTTATQGWWLDLRQGLGTVPSWWGPHAQVAPSCMATSQTHDNEPDRGWHAVEGTGNIELIHQPNTYTENAKITDIIAILQTGELNAGRPFDRKLWKRIRVVGLVAQDAEIEVSATIDSGVAIAYDPITLTGDTSAAQWNIASWNISHWGSSVYSEGETITPATRARGRTCAIRLHHRPPKAVALREIEIRYETVVRPTRTVPTDSNS